MTHQILLTIRYNQLISKFPICHRLPDRTFKLGKWYFPVCARCTGFYIGTFSYFIYVYFNYVQYSTLLVIFGFLMMVPTFIDGFTQYLNFRESNNNLRLFTGLMGGLGLGIIVKAFKFFLLYGVI